MYSIGNIKQCCRYSYSVYTGINLSECLKANPWLFEDAYFLMAYYDSTVPISEEILNTEKERMSNNFILFSGMEDDFKRYLNMINWDDFGTWYVYLFPTELKSDRTICIGTESFLDKGKGYNTFDYDEISNEWKFIHEQQADLFITRQKNGVLVGALSELNLMRIEMPKQKIKSNLKKINN